MVWNSIADGLLRLGFQAPCPLCQRKAKATFCPDCFRQLQACRSQQFGPPVFAWGNYTGALKRAIALLKYDSKPAIAQPLGQWLAKAWILQKTARQLVIVPVPLHRDRQSQRGYNQADLIARSFGQIVGMRVCSHGLTRQQATQAQFGLTITERRRNLEGAFALGPDFKRKPPKWPVLLLDDIYTTGATIQAVTQVLLESGIHVYGTVTVAEAKRFHHPKQA